jgi:hypothetical protein
MPETTNTTNTKKQTNPLVYIGIGCLVLIVLIGLGGAIVGRFFAKKVSVGLLQNAIEQKTGVKTNLQDVEKGKVTFTDTKTGAKVDIGSGKIPDTFPKDFPLYPNAKVASAMSGAQAEKNNGFWLTMTTPDSVDAVSTFYKSQLGATGWTIDATYTAGNTTTETMSKSGWSGSLAISSDSSSKETQIVIILGQQEVTPTDTP